MRTTVPPAFNMTFVGPEGPYTVRFKPIDDWDGMIDVSIAGQPMQWSVVDADREDTGGLVLGGMTTGTKDLWNDQFWFALRLADAPPVIQYWEDQVIWRQDNAA